MRALFYLGLHTTYHPYIIGDFCCVPCLTGTLLSTATTEAYLKAVPALKKA